MLPGKELSINLWSCSWTWWLLTPHEKVAAAFSKLILVAPSNYLVLEVSLALPLYGMTLDEFSKFQGVKIAKKEFTGSSTLRL